jgi:hypothetical protein
MIFPESPPGFVARTEAQKVAFDNGFRLERGSEGGWLRYGSTTARGDIWIAAFDASKVSFSDQGEPLFHPDLGKIERNLLCANAAPRLVGLTAKHAVNLARHRQQAGL